MASAGPRRGAIIEGINVTPLVDITLVLLIIFIVTAKLVVTPAVPLDLPQASQSEQVQTVLSIVVPAEGALEVDGAAIDERELASKARSALGRDHELRAVIQADRASSHGRVMSVLDTLKAAGLVRVAFGAVRPSQGNGPPPSTAEIAP
jgi:biopolymer transport protein TolR